MISICLPSRRRARFFKRMCESALDTAGDVNNIEFAVYRDEDDKHVYEYFGNHKVVVGKRKDNFFGMWNDAQQISTGPYYMYMADDFVLDTKDWDKEVMQLFDKYNDKIVLLAVNDGTSSFKYGYSGIGVVHKNWVDAVGYLFPDYFYPNCADKWVNDLAVLVNRLEKTKFSCTPKEDETHDRVHWRKCHLTRRWRLVYWEEEATRLRQQDADKLMKVINEYKIINSNPSVK